MASEGPFAGDELIDEEARFEGSGLVVVIVCVAGAITTVAAGCWQSAKFVAASAGAAAACGATASCSTGACATCTLPVKLVAADIDRVGRQQR